MEAFPMIGLALQVELPIAAANIPGSKVGEECWNSCLDARLEAVEASIQLEAVAATLKFAWLWETVLVTSWVLYPYENPIT
jgi:hypothetical protein